MSLFSSKNRFLLTLIIIFVFINLPTNQAKGQSIGGQLKCSAIGAISPHDFVKCMLADFGIDEGMLRETLKYADVSNFKKLQPQVKITFSSTNPNPGEELTANALPLNFSNQPKSLYYTWYLQPEYCREDNLDKEVNGVKNRVRCNLNKDYDHNGIDIVDIEDFKIKAMRIYASNGFEVSEGDYSKSDKESAYKTIHGGEDQQGKPDYCYFHDVELGKQYAFRKCFNLFPDAPGYETGDNSFSAGEEYFWHTNPDDPDTAETGHPDEANVAGLGAQNFTWNYQSGDSIGVVVEGISFDATLYKDSSYKIMWAVPNNTCGDLEKYIDKPGKSVDDYTTTISPKSWPDCPDGCEFTRTVTKRKTTDKSQSEISSFKNTSYKIFTKTEKITLASRRRVVGAGTATGGSTTTVDGTTTNTGGTANLVIGTGTYDPFGFTEEQINICNENDTADLVSNGFFTQAEVDSDEKYRVLLADNSSCCDSSFVNEEDGTALCSIKPNETTITITEEMTDLNTDPEDSLFNMTEDDFNECLLEKNLLTPTEGGGKNEKLEVSLSYSPTNPVNDTSDEGDNADWINIVSTVENSTDSKSLHYSWTAYSGEFADADGKWDPLIKSQLIGASQTVGAGIPNLKFKANFPAAPKYLKIKLNVSEALSGTSDESKNADTRKGHAEVIIALSSFNNKLSVFNTSVDDSLALTQGSQEICKIYGATDPTILVDAAICQIAPNEIIAVKADIVPETGETWNDYDFFWTLNNQNLSYNYVSNFIEPGNLIFFPVLVPKGSALNLSLTATNQKTGTKISLAKNFLVSEPTFKIISSDESTSKPKTLGYYIDLDGKKWPDYSQTEFLAKTNSTIKLTLSQFAAFPFPSAEDLPITWYWNDTQLATTDRSLSFDATEKLSGSFSLKAQGTYTQDRNTKKALNKYWDVPIDAFYERQLSQEIDFTFDSIDESTSAQKNQGKILASFISSVPAYFAFLFRIVMTTFVLLGTIWILFALFPQTQNND